MPAPQGKTCAGCGRRIEWRKKWASSWDAVRWCSDACRRRGVTAIDRELEEILENLLDERGRRGVDPDEAADRLDPTGEQSLREPARRAARRLVANGQAELVQHGRVVDPSTARGAVVLRRS